MKIRRFAVPPGTVEGETAILRDDLARYVRSVVRLKPGSPIVLFDGEGREWAGHVRKLRKGEIVIEIGSEAFVEPGDEGPPVLLLFSLARGSHTDLAVQKVTELGVSEIRLFVSERTVAIPRPGGDPVRIDRLERIATDAARQSGRAHVPPVEPPVPFLDALEEVEEATDRVILWVGETSRSFAEALGEWSRDRPLVVVVGPEGGFTDAEVRQARELGFRPAHLGPLTLRSETAAIAAVACARLLA